VNNIVSDIVEDILTDTVDALDNTVGILDDAVNTTGDIVEDMVRDLLED